MPIKPSQPVAWKKPVYFCSCDMCGSVASQGDPDPGNSSELARKQGFITVSLIDITLPMRWLCPNCAMAREKKMNGKSFVQKSN